MSHEGHWQAFYNHVAHRHGDEVSDTWWVEEGRFSCNDCKKRDCNNRQAGHSCQELHVPPFTTSHSTDNPLNNATSANTTLNLASLNTTNIAPEANAAPAHQTTEGESVQVIDPPLPRLLSISALPIHTCKDIPDRCRQEWAKTRSGRLSTAIHENTLEAQKKKKEEEKKATLRAERTLVRDGELSRPRAALTSEPLAPDDEATYAKLPSKHPPRRSTSNVQNRLT